MPILNSKKPASELSQNYAACKMRELRQRRKNENQEKLLQDQRKYQKHYNTEYLNIRKTKPVYNDPPFEYQPVNTEREEESKQTNSDKDEDEHSDNNISVSVTVDSDKLDNMLDEAIDELTKEEEHKSKTQKKNEKRRQQIKQIKKGNKLIEPIDDKAD